MTAKHYLSKQNQHVLTEFLRDAVETVGRDKIKLLLPAPITISIQTRVNGCQVWIDAKAEGRDPLELWAGSIGSGSPYSEARKNPLGINPDAADWAEPILMRFFETVTSLHVEIIGERSMGKAEMQAKTTEQINADKDYYHSLFTSPNVGRDGG